MLGCTTITAAGRRTDAPRDDFCARSGRRIFGYRARPPGFVGVGEGKGERAVERTNERNPLRIPLAALTLFISRGESVAESKPILFIFAVDTATVPRENDRGPRARGSRKVPK